MTKDTFRLKKRKIRVAISPFCNLNCLYCSKLRGEKRSKFGAMEDFRGKPLNQGVISTETTVKIIEALHRVGFEGVTFTGGEPLLNPEWDIIIRKSKEIGMSQICLTTNGTLLGSYLHLQKKMPKELTLLTVSLDSFNPLEFEFNTGGAKLDKVIEAVKMVKKCNPKLTIRVNNVVMRKNFKSLPQYIEYCEKLGVIDQINLLNLILKEPRNKIDKKFFEKEFVFPSEIVNFLSKEMGYHFYLDEKYEHRTKTTKGIEIIVKDTNLTLRNIQCEKCPIYCQEGFYTVRVATDGTIRTCIDYYNELPFIDGAVELAKGTLIKKLREIIKTFERVELKYTLNTFFKKYKIRLKPQFF